MKIGLFTLLLFLVPILGACSQEKGRENSQVKKETTSYEEVSGGGGNGVPTSQSN
ncbi:MAG: hypothetical protein GY828_05340, partial [Candidatus Gracilibacteria bacterium]|nr:hypothetical protein [Candidatus Gracilibacteria bacterium]